MSIFLAKNSSFYSISDQKSLEIKYLHAHDPEKIGRNTTNALTMSRKYLDATV